MVTSPHQVADPQTLESSQNENNEVIVLWFRFKRRQENRIL